MLEPLLDQLKELAVKAKAWLKPDASDPKALQAIKLLLKGIVMLLAVALSPIALVILIFAFMAAF